MARIVKWLVVIFAVAYMIMMGTRNWLHANQLMHYKRTMADICTLAQAVNAYKADHGMYPPAQSSADLTKFLVPKYLETAISQDDWKRPLKYQVWKSPGSDEENFGIASAAKDGAWQFPNIRQYHAGMTKNLKDDIVILNGHFFHWYEGMAIGGRCN